MSKLEQLVLTIFIGGLLLCSVSCNKSNPYVENTNDIKTEVTTLMILKVQVILRQRH